MATQPMSNTSRLWSWLRFVAYAIIVIVWVVTIGSMFSGVWPTTTRWLVLLSATAIAAASRVQDTHPGISSGIFIVAVIVMTAAMWGVP